MVILHWPGKANGETVHLEDGTIVVGTMKSMDEEKKDASVIRGQFSGLSEVM